MLANKLRAATAAGGALAIEDVFSTYLYDGNGSTQTITNGIDLAGEGGLVWVKRRDGVGSQLLHNTESGANKVLAAESTGSEFTYSSPEDFQSFNSDGFTVGDGNQVAINTSGWNFVSWTFRKAPRFFDVVTYTGNGSDDHAISHNLGVTPGFIVTKRTDSADDWSSFHRGLDATNPYQYWVELNTTSARQFDSKGIWFKNPDDTNFYLSSYSNANASGGTYVAYLFAHDPLGPSGDGSDGLIACGSYTGPGSNLTVDLGWEPQYVLVKRATGTGNWIVVDMMRDINRSRAGELFPNLSNAEASGANDFDVLTPTGFTVQNGSVTNYSGSDYIYLAIRRGPMRAPTSGTEVFDAHYKSPSTFPTTVDTGFVTDAVFHSMTTSAAKALNARLTTLSLPTYLAIGESSFGTVTFDYSSAQDGFTKASGWGGTGNQLYYSFRRAPGFFDVVAYAGNATVGRTVSHNLGVAPEMMMVKCRTLNGPDWAIYYGDPTDYLKFTNVATADAADYWNDTAPTESVFTLGNKSDVNGSGQLYIAYLFATLDGVSKVGSYTGNGSSQTINCGFTSGARFVLIKRTDSTGDWYIWDTARGIVTGNDPHLSLNNVAAQVTTDDSIDPDSSGFIVNQVAATNINVSSASYIYLAIS